MKKRAMIELHFNWIFVLIAGAIIFVFFVSIVNKQREFSELKTSGTIITNLESILTGAQISTNTVNIVDMPKVDIGFECDRYFIGQVPKQTKGNIIFSPDLLKGKKLITWALDWNMPYRVTNFLYLTDPEVRYILMDNGDEVLDKIFEKLPKEMNKEIISDPTKFIDKNNYKVKFIFFGNVNDDVLSNLKNMPDEDVTAINLIDLRDSDIIENTGTIIFLQKKGVEWEPKGETYYLKKESLFGAIFAADSEMYNCVMRKAFKKLNLVTKIYFKRCGELENYYFYINNACYAPHGGAKSKLSDMEVTSGQESGDFPNNGIGGINAMAGYSSNIKNENQRAQLFSCALIY